MCVFFVLRGFVDTSLLLGFSSFSAGFVERKRIIHSSQECYPNLEQKQLGIHVDMLPHMHAHSTFKLLHAVPTDGDASTLHERLSSHCLHCPLPYLWESKHRRSVPDLQTSSIEKPKRHLCMLSGKVLEEIIVHPLNHPLHHPHHSPHLSASA